MMMMKIMMVTITAVRMTKTGLSDTLLIGISAPSHGLTVSLMIMMIIMMTGIMILMTLFDYYVDTPLKDISVPSQALIVSLMIMIFIATVLKFRKKCSNTNFGFH